ncbi:exodeoxyribonuclease VII large subunit [Limosilactobacillus fastidiosus]|uniref:Exodeoxyribonuclease 7 large subunit n=1 Tax=Limosilactobacillus fastidiosus TaxID=2759855 RepID=A0A7W3YD64_9LACO|nr:exodeoxyribonuclease VII large subunit [Limosilactobacillus fastidiosus]MBB1063739.1 exodeoxyribonuclease VII large subunit [Limosilactobacillus fastidiosus]MBB1086732.1 exodeoxyribonuclease VII large subunit [Limosilactobacillus fastidiosus]MCD7084314.1 exodeoxyribonuclease VII large subunit [Limosilactobacillus fastidiosus]MCD7085541.1 exodeoxyribonuclease VII large subunit [Limosilactobacillus fastidiosus]MCD7114772.1 exodeoxyribonuclease VII large subunit [Limosilactobacillus fastidiosu
MDRSQYLTVSELTSYLKQKFDRDPYLKTVYLTGELSNFRLRQRHQYFSIKDENAVIDAVMFERQFRKVNFRPETGMKILVVGHIGLYEKSGRYQIYVERMEPDGLGALYLQFEQLKKKLGGEGLFDQIPRPIPQFPKRIAVVTSLDGAVIRDINTTVRRRYPIAQVVLFPTVVQGDKAAADIARQINRANQMGNFDTMIIGRGGGSLEDLWPFNEEIVARAIADSQIPVISSVGHETDTTIADLVADQRAATPTAAAELATPNRLADILMTLQDDQVRLNNTMKNVINFDRKQLQKQLQSYIFQQPSRLYENYAQKLDQLIQTLNSNVKNLVKDRLSTVQQLQGRLRAVSPQHTIERTQEKVDQLQNRLLNSAKNSQQQRQQKLISLIQQLDSLSPLKIMGRGYTYVTYQGAVVNTVKELEDNQEVTLHFNDGKATAKITGTEEK